MPKMKTKSGAKKRFGMTGTVKRQREQGYKSHILTKRSTKRTRTRTYSAIVDKADVPAIREMLAV